MMERKEELLKELEAIEINGEDLDSAYTKLRIFAEEIGADNLLNEFIEYETLENLAKTKLEVNTIGYVKDFLNGINDLNHTVFYIKDNYSVRNVTKVDLACLKHNIKDELKSWVETRTKKEILKDLEEIEIRGDNLDDSFDSLYDIAEEIGAENFASNFANYQQLEEIATYKLESGDAFDVKHFLDKVTEQGPYDLYYVDEDDDYARDVYKNDLLCLKYALKEELEG